MLYGLLFKLCFMHRKIKQELFFSSAIYLIYLNNITGPICLDHVDIVNMCCL